MGIQTLVTVVCDNCDTIVGDEFYDLSEWGFIFCIDCMNGLTAKELMFNYLHQGEEYKHLMVLDPLTLEGYRRKSDG